MDFRYKKDNYKNVLKVFPIAMIVMTIIFYLRSISDGLPFHKILLFLIGVNAICAIIGALLYQWYKYLTLNVIITINDNGIIFKEKSQAKRIDWVDINKIEWVPQGRYSPGAIKIISEIDTIKITTEVENLQMIVKTIKGKMGDKFLTYDIPFEYK